VALTNSQTINNNDRIARSVPPRNRNIAAGASRRARNTGNAKHVAPYVTRRAIALIVKAATNELFKVRNIMIAAVIRIDTHGVENRR
jgi:hypothetical protein